MPEQEQQVTAFAGTNIITIIGVIIMLIAAAGYFVGGHEVSDLVRNTIHFAYPFGTATVTISMLWLYLRNVTENKMRGFSAWVLLTTAAFFIFGQVEGLTGANYGLFYVTFGTPMIWATMSMVAFTTVAVMFRRYIAVTPMTAYAIILSSIAILAFSPLGTLVAPPIVDLGTWIQTNIVGPDASGYWGMLFLGGAALGARLITLAQKFTLGE